MSRGFDQQRRLKKIGQRVQKNAAKVQALLAGPRTELPPRVIRPSISTPTRQRYATSAAPTDWSSNGRFAGITDAILTAVEDGIDRVVLAWPFAPLAGFPNAAVAMREARSTGRLAHLTLGFWPWRPGATWSARSILVHPWDVQQAATRFATDLRIPQPWADPKLGHTSQYLLELRLGDLQPKEGFSAQNKSRDSILVRSPNLLETSSVFIPLQHTAAPYQSDSDQVLRRVRDHTHMGDKNAGLVEHVAAAGNPRSAPFAIFGIPAERKPDRLARYLSFARFAETGLDVILVDLTKTARPELGLDWEKGLTILINALGLVPGRRPPIVVLADDVFSMRKAAKALKAFSNLQRPRRPNPLEVGVYTPEPGAFGTPFDVHNALSTVSFEVDIKDASLAGLRRDLIKLGRKARDDGQSQVVEGVAKALSLLRRSASAPIGLAEARTVGDILYDADDEVDAAVRSLFRPKMILAPLASAVVLAPEYRDLAVRLIEAISKKLALWSDQTPVSAKLESLLKDNGWNNRNTLIAIGDRRVMDIYIGSDTALKCKCAVTDHRGLRQETQKRAYDRMIVIGPTPETVRTMLSAPRCPLRTLLLGDAAGSALVIAEVEAVSHLVGFEHISPRAQSLAAALRRGGVDEQLDLAEAEFRIAAVVPEGEIDLTQSGEAYRGDIVYIHTAHGHRLAYRMTSDVLVSSPGESRPFEKEQAQAIKPGMRILVFTKDLREPLRRALADSREALAQLTLYHNHIQLIKAGTPGSSTQEKARNVLAAMRSLDPEIHADELPNIVRWMTAGQTAGTLDGAKQPRAARDWKRFRLFMEATGVSNEVAKLYWRTAIVPTRSYRAQEGHYFNQRVVQFVQDPEGTTVGTAAWGAMVGLWQLIVEAVDEVVSVDIIPGGRFA